VNQFYLILESGDNMLVIPRVDTLRFRAIISDKHKSISISDYNSTTDDFTLFDQSTSNYLCPLKHYCKKRGLGIRKLYWSRKPVKTISSFRRKDDN